MGAQTSKVPLSDHSIDWHRTQLAPDVSARLHALSDFHGAVQTLGFLSVLAGCFAGALWFSSAGFVAASVACGLAYGCVANFLINGMHELGHGSVFRTQALNDVFLRIISFLGWLHPDLFFSSHLRHHRFTQNAPHDQENPMPIRITVWDFLSFGFINVRGCVDILSQTVRAALGIYPTGHLGWLPGWEEMLYPSDLPSARAPAQRWACVLLVGHIGFAAACVSRGWYVAPLLLSFGPFVNGWLFFLCNATQHVGMLPGVADFRKNTRTFVLHPAISFLYWRMNFHLEHHMWPRVPCYNLAALHEAIKHDTPPAAVGIAAVWREISAAMAAREADAARAGSAYSEATSVVQPPPQQRSKGKVA